MTVTTPAAANQAVTGREVDDFGHGLQQIVSGIERLAAGRYTDVGTSTLLACLAGSDEGDDVLALIAGLIARLGDVATNPGLAELTPARQAEVRRLTSLYAAHDRDFAPRRLVTEACGYSDPMCDGEPVAHDDALEG